MIPELVEKQEIEFYHNYDILNHKTISNAFPSKPFRVVPDFSPNSQLLARCTRELLSLLHSAPGTLHWTFDVVYSLKTWMRVLNVDTVQLVQNILGLDNQNDLLQKWIVFNARTQFFEYRVGFTNQQLLGYLDPKVQNSSNLRGVLKRCFSMLTADGKPPSHNEAKAFHDKFTPEFYPMRYELKDDIYSQYLQTLDLLLNHVLHEVYAPSGVKYVEFSVGFNDLITRPWVFHHLASKPDARPGTPTPTFRYLAAFGRQHSPLLLDDSPPESLPDPLSEALYSSYVDKLATLKVNVRHPPLQQVLVGLDYVGDEKNHPYCPFGLKSFTDFVMDCRYHPL